ncbi:MAG: glycosyltransferase family 4 protein, partial [Chloroflexota bacterium]
ILPNFSHIPQYYQALDCYLVASREEGGPKAVLEAQAAGVPLITTRVGLVADVVTDMEDGIVINIGDVDAMKSAILRFAEDLELTNKLIENGLKNAQKYAWEEIASAYYDQVYAPLLTT